MLENPNIGSDVEFFALFLNLRRFDKENATLANERH